MSFRKLNMEELGRKSPEEFKKAPKISVILLLDNVRSMQNVGSIFRTADAFCIEKILLCGITATPPHREIHKSALGATESVNWEYYQNSLEAICKYSPNGYKVMALEQTTQSTLLQEIEPKATEKYLLVVGNEVEGVSNDTLKLCEKVIEIPQSGTKHSLNVAISTGIMLWHFYSNTNGNTR